MRSKRLLSVLFGLKALLIIVCLALLGACTSVPVDEREARRAEIDREAEETIALLIGRDPEFTAALEQSAGYFTSVISSATVAVVGRGYGIGVLVDKLTGNRTYLNFKRTDLGAGLAMQKFYLNFKSAAIFIVLHHDTHQK